jgi:hypothetical protein
MRRYGRYQILNEKWIVNLVKSMNNKKRRWDMFKGKKIKDLYEQLGSLQVKNSCLEQRVMVLKNKLEYNNIISVKYDSRQIYKDCGGYEMCVKEAIKDGYQLKGFISDDNCEVWVKKGME